MKLNLENFLSVMLGLSTTWKRFMGWKIARGTHDTKVYYLCYNYHHHPHSAFYPSSSPYLYHQHHQHRQFSPIITIPYAPHHHYHNHHPYSLSPPPSLLPFPSTIIIMTNPSLAQPPFSSPNTTTITITSPLLSITITTLIIIIITNLMSYSIIINII